MKSFNLGRAKSQLGLVLLVLVSFGWLVACDNKNLGGAQDNRVASIDSAACSADRALFWDSRLSPAQCRYKPKELGECNNLSGTWDTTTRCCYLSGLAPVCLY